MNSESKSSTKPCPVAHGVRLRPRVGRFRKESELTEKIATGEGSSRFTLRAIANHDLADPLRQLNHPIVAKRILFVISSLGAGGAERQMVVLIEALTLRGARCEVFVLDGSGPLRQRLDTIGVRIHDVGMTGASSDLVSPAALGSAFVHLWRIIRLTRPDILQAYLPLTNFMGALAGALTRVPLIITCRRGLGTHQDKHRWWRTCDRVANHLSHLVTANSQAVAKDTMDRDRLSPAKIVIIPNGLDLTSFPVATNREPARNELGLASGEIGIVCVANLIPYKGHADLFEALAIARSKLPPFRLFAVGRDDGIGNELRALAQKLDLEARVSYLGSRKDVGTILSAMDVFVLASHEEGSSNALLEAMASGLPIVATDVGGNREALDNGRYGLIVPPRDPTALSVALETIVSELHDWRANAAATVRYARETYSVKRLVENFIALYTGLH